MIGLCDRVDCPGRPGEEYSPILALTNDLFWLGTFWVQEVLERTEEIGKQNQNDTLFGTIHEKHWFAWIR
jgi:hypothetical protein